MSQDTADAAPATRRLSRRRAVLISAIALILIAAIALVAVSCTNSGQNGPPTVRVDRGPVALAVSASGTIAPSGRQSLGFADGGTVTQVAVKVGDRVEAGQVLARVDGRVALQTLRQQQATVDQQTAVLDKLRGGDTVGAAQASLDQASAIERATRSQVDATNAANRSATSRARTQLRFDQSSLDRAEDQLQADRSACRASPRTTTPTAPAAAAPAAGAAVPTGGAAPTGGAVPTGGQTAVPTQPRPTAQPVPTQTVPIQPVPTTQPRPTTQPVPTTQPRPTTQVRPTTQARATSAGPANAERTVTTNVALKAASAPLDTDVDDDVDLADERTSPACQRILSDRQTVQQAEAAVVQSRTALEAAEQRENTDAEAGQVSIENARQGVVTAQNQLATASNDRAPDIAAQEALVENAQAAAAVAQRDVDETVIRAPVAGTITAINGAPGEVVAPPTAVTPLAPGGDAPLPVEAAAGGGAASAAGAGAPGAGAFVVLDAADPFQLVVPFEEADAARVQPGQLVDVSVDALPNDNLTGRVTSVAPSGQDISGIVSYYTTIVVDGGADRLRDGQTAEAAVRVDAVENALRVPAAAVGRTDGRPSVTVTGPDGDPVTRSFLPGLVGDDYVEVRSGLTDGEEVRLPQATVTTAPGPQGPPPAN